MWGAYARLGAYLAGRARAGVAEVTLTFAQVEALVGHPLPDRARTRTAWWSNAPEHPSRVGSYHWYGWLSVGWEATPDVPGGAVTFRYRPRPNGPRPRGARR